MRGHTLEHTPTIRKMKECNRNSQHKHNTRLVQPTQHNIFYS